ncbi:MAG: DUF1289 domain-containing protein [Hyphomicrobium sp.]|nr:DUF1289 domain-containing protein [Hyphomicrobium sp.]
MTAISPPARASRHSPCVGVCQLETASQLCLGCGRSRDEISHWISMSEVERDDIWELIPDRLSKLSVAVRLLPWTAPELLGWIVDTIQECKGTWVTGVPGAVAELPCTGEHPATVKIAESTVVATMENAALRVHVTDKLRAFAFAEGGPIVLGLPRTRDAFAPVQSFTKLGPDTNALNPRHRAGILFDFGLGRKNARFCIRSHSPELTARLTSLCGETWAGVLSAAGATIIAASPPRVVESAAARIEIFAPIPPPGGQSPAGAHSHFLPQFLEKGEEVPESLRLPGYAMQVAIFYPKRA